MPQDDKKKKLNQNKLSQMLKGETWNVEKKLTQIDSSELTSSTLIGKKLNQNN